MQHVFIVGSKGIPGAYGGYETFVDKLTQYHQNLIEIKYHVACKSTESGEFEYQNAHCFKIKVPNIGPAQAIYYDVAALSFCCSFIKKRRIRHPVIYVLACRIGPFASFFQKKIHKLDGKIYVNPDGHEWMRSKWSAPVKQYWKISERLMVKYSDLLICDSKGIEQYIQDSYKKYYPKTLFLSYGAEILAGFADDDPHLLNWYKEKQLSLKSYYLVVGRFVPENNYEIMIREFMQSKTERDLALITNVSETFLNELRYRTGFDKDQRIKFVGTVYDQSLLGKIRKNAYAYIHGHEVGGTNPSLLEALATTELNLLLNVCFNREVAENTALYWSKQKGDLAHLIDKADKKSAEELEENGRRARERITEAYSWPDICKKYAKVFYKNS